MEPQASKNSQQVLELPDNISSARKLEINTSDPTDLHQIIKTTPSLQNEQKLTPTISATFDSLFPSVQGSDEAQTTHSNDSKENGAHVFPTTSSLLFGNNNVSTLHSSGSSSAFHLDVSTFNSPIAKTEDSSIKNSSNVTQSEAMLFSESRTEATKSEISVKTEENIKNTAAMLLMSSDVTREIIAETSSSNLPTSLEDNAMLQEDVTTTKIVFETTVLAEQNSSKPSTSQMKINETTTSQTSERLDQFTDATSMFAFGDAIHSGSGTSFPEDTSFLQEPISTVYEAISQESSTSKSDVMVSPPSGTLTKMPPLFYDMLTSAKNRVNNSVNFTSPTSKMPMKTENEVESSGGVESTTAVLSVLYTSDKVATNHSYFQEEGSSLYSTNKISPKEQTTNTFTPSFYDGSGSQPTTPSFESNSTHSLIKTKTTGFVTDVPLQNPETTQRLTELSTIFEAITEADSAIPVNNTSTETVILAVDTSTLAAPGKQTSPELSTSETETTIIDQSVHFNNGISNTTLNSSSDFSATQQITTAVQQQIYSTPPKVISLDTTTPTSGLLHTSFSTVNIRGALTSKPSSVSMDSEIVPTGIETSTRLTSNATTAKVNSTAEEATALSDATSTITNGYLITTSSETQQTVVSFESSIPGSTVSTTPESDELTTLTSLTNVQNLTSAIDSLGTKPINIFRLPTTDSRTTSLSLSNENFTATEVNSFTASSVSAGPMISTRTNSGISYTTSTITQNTSTVTKKLLTDASSPVLLERLVNTVTNNLVSQSETFTQTSSKLKVTKNNAISDAYAYTNSESFSMFTSSKFLTILSKSFTSPEKTASSDSTGKTMTSKVETSFSAKVTNDNTNSFVDTATTTSFISVNKDDLLTNKLSTIGGDSQTTSTTSGPARSSSTNAPHFLSRFQTEFTTVPLSKSDNPTRFELSMKSQSTSNHDYTTSSLTSFSSATTNTTPSKSVSSVSTLMTSGNSIPDSTHKRTTKSPANAESAFTSVNIPTLSSSKIISTSPSVTSKYEGITTASSYISLLTQSNSNNTSHFTTGASVSAISTPILIFAGVAVLLISVLVLTLFITLCSDKKKRKPDDARENGNIPMHSFLDSGQHTSTVGAGSSVIFGPKPKFSTGSPESNSKRSNTFDVMGRLRGILMSKARKFTINQNISSSRSTTQEEDVF